jgi:predicted GNAT superfamily acetyltransferase
MTESASAEVTAGARAHGLTAANRAGVDVRPLTTSADLRAAAELFTDLWGTPFSDHVLRALELSGNYVSGAFGTDQSAPGGLAPGGATARRLMVGASIAFLAVADEPELHSHITGVLTSQQRSGVGLALKLHQRCWALERGIATITWTFDPLVRRNAAFNLARLGATADEYLENVYGSMADALNGDDESDRLLVRWRLADPTVEAASAGVARRVPVRTDLAEALRPGPDGNPLVLPLEGPGPQCFSCTVPDDIQSMRASRPEVARAWRLALRQVLGGALGVGGRLLGLDADDNYVVERGPGLDDHADDNSVAENGNRRP